MISPYHNSKALFCFCYECVCERLHKGTVKKVARDKTNPPFRICHFSDGHGKWLKLPKADMYIITGDLLPNFSSLSPEPSTGGAKHKINKRTEIFKQNKLVLELAGKGRETLLSNPKAPVVIVRGNHDFVSLSKLFGGDNTYEIGSSPTVFDNICGFKIGGIRGIRYIQGVWSDEMHEDVFGKLVDSLPNDLDILVTHAPPYNMLDSRNSYYGKNEHFGLKCLRKKFHADKNNLNENLRLHCFGHVHEAFGTYKTGEPAPGSVVGPITISNAAGGIVCFEWDGKKMRLERATQSLTKKDGDCRSLIKL